MLTTMQESAAVSAASAPRQPITLTGYDLEQVIEALRRDMRHQESLAHSNNEYAHLAAFAARKDRDLLEYLNPKHQLNHL